ncbi:hypothetical protein [Roseimarinus sediminis]|uniref:hypothetical protein n=1 Tax=Roseimarinus sediminis TaxID=1610899 RepID=UPI003D1F74D3
MKLIDRFRTASDLNRFLIKGGALYLVWRIIRKWMLLQGQYLMFFHWLGTTYVYVARFFLQLVGFDVIIDPEKNLLWINGSAGAVKVVYDCLAVNLFFIYLIFIIAYPGNIRLKLRFAVCGLVLIYLLNAMRMAALSIIVMRIPHLMDLFHHFIFQGLIYLFIFGLWYYFSKQSKPIS